MASNKELIIEQAGSVCPGESPHVGSSVTETTPLVVKSSTVRRSGLLGRLRESVLIKSKAANMILFWSALAHLWYGFMLNPDNIFTVPINQLFHISPLVYNDPYSNINKLLNATSGAITFINMIGSGVYGLIALWLLFYPLAGYLADVHYGRYKVVVSIGLRMMWMAFMVFIIGESVISILFWPIFNLWGPYADHKLYNLLVSVYAVLSGVMGLLFYLMVSIGFAAFAANVIQFGIDQLQDLPARDSFLFIHWFLLTQYIGVSIGKLAWSVSIVSGFTSLSVYILAGLVFIIAIPLSLCISKHKWFTKDTGLGNPYREVARVVDFARKHKIPIQRSAFTYWEDDIPTGLDLGKSKYGGPFTTEQVENVKALFGIFLLILSLGPFFTADIAASAFLPILKHHMDNWTPIFRPFWNWNFIPYSMFANGGTLYPLFIVILIPIYLKIIDPLFKRYIPNILKRIGIGLCLITVSLLCSLLVDTIGHILPSGKKATSVFSPGKLINRTEVYPDFNITDTFLVDAPSLQLSPHFLIIQNFLVAVAYILIYGGAFEFICAQSPHSMKGVLIGIFFAVKGLFQLIGVLGILLPFSFWQNSPRAGLVYFLLNIVISIVGVVAFTVTARRYQYRQRDEFCNERKYIEEVYEKDVSHNPVFEDLDFTTIDSDQDDASFDPETAD